MRETSSAYITAGEAPELAGELANTLIPPAASYHAGLVGKYILENLTDTPIRVEQSDEFIYGGRILPGTNTIGITQSGETLDVLKAVKRLKETGGHVTAITNVVGSSISRAADRTIYTRAGPEISVAATKTFIAQLIAFYWLAMPYARVDSRRLDEVVTETRQCWSRCGGLDNEAEIAHRPELVDSQTPSSSARGSTTRWRWKAPSS
jgi:glucosamine 6-phosphate synthetase-like amidotransferase/phosphosugar isomerase protein